MNIYQKLSMHIKEKYNFIYKEQLSLLISLNFLKKFINTKF